MASSARIFFAGVGTTFLILGAGFGGGLLMANSALKEPTGYQAKSKAEPSAPARVILPTTAQAAHPPEQPQEVVAVEPAPQPIQAAPAASQAEKVDTKKAERDRKKRIAERKVKRQLAQARVRQLEPRQEPRIMAFGSEDPQRGFGFFGQN